MLYTRLKGSKCIYKPVKIKPKKEDFLVIDTRKDILKTILKENKK